MSMFINRKEELKLLESIYNSNKAELVLVYGRRRIGKSTLLRESIKNRNALYLLADLSKNILDIFSIQINEKYVKFSNWDDFFDFIEKSEYEIFIIDEFQYLYNLDKAWPSILQRRWETLKKTKKKLILCGSIISTIYKISSGYGSALYGRKTYEIEIRQLNFEHIKEFFNYKKEDLVKIYAILGGIPRYLEEFDKNKSIKTNIKEKILNKNSFLYNEPINILFEEFRDSSSYISILLAISQGFNKFNEISQYSKIEPNKLPKYLNVLERIKIIEKLIPITENKIKGKITHYKIKDNFFKFWFKFILKNKSRIEQGFTEQIYNEIDKEITTYIGNIFEEICIDFLIKKNNYSNIGSWWHKDKEIDIIALSEQKNEILFAECKWQNSLVDVDVYYELKEKSKFVNYKREEREKEKNKNKEKSNKINEKFALFSKSGFTKKMKELAKKEKVLLYEIDDIL